MKAERAYRRYIQEHQLAAQEKILDAEILRIEINLDQVVNEKTFRLLRELKILKESIQAAKKDLLEIPVARKKIWDRLVIKVYDWAVSDRLK